METQKILVNPEPVSDDSEKTAEAEAHEALLQQQIDELQRLLKECEADPTLIECIDDPKVRDEALQLGREIMAELPEFLRSKLPDSATTEEKRTERHKRSAAFREKFGARFIKIMKARKVITSESREKNEALMKFLEGN
ncbi:MAG: hypothetical protein OXI43_08615 [Candidatus Poribacteria bacterium]|nr:hypothetical protein [Candidatus Poribacteria bacterium]